MEIKIKNKKQPLSFGVKFVRELDKIAGLERENISLGMGLTKTLPGLDVFDPAVLSDIIYCATFGNSPRPGRNDVDDYIDGLEVRELEALFDDVKKEVNEANAIKAAIKNRKA